MDKIKKILAEIERLRKKDYDRLALDKLEKFVKSQQDVPVNEGQMKINVTVESQLFSKYGHKPWAMPMACPVCGTNIMVEDINNGVCDDDPIYISLSCPVCKTWVRTMFVEEKRTSVDVDRFNTDRMSCPHKHCYTEYL